MMRALRSLFTILRREPLFGFALAGGLIFGLYASFGSDGRQRIVITPEMIRDMVQLREQVLDRPIVPAERLLLIEAYVEREILVREAMALGLHQRDGQVRHRLADKMAFLLREDPSEPTVADLQALYDNEPKRYQTPATVTFEHAYFASDSASAKRWLQDLKAGQTTAATAATAGDTFWMGRRLQRISQKEIAAVMGTDFARELMAQPVGEWSGPLRSERGWHVVRVEQHQSPQPLPNDLLQQQLRRD